MQTIKKYNPRNPTTIKEMRGAEQPSGFQKKKTLKYNSDSDESQELGNSIFLISDEEKSDKGNAMEEEEEDSSEEDSDSDEDDDGDDDENKDDDEKAEPNQGHPTKEIVVEQESPDKAGFNEADDGESGGEEGENEDKGERPAKK